MAVATIPTNRLLNAWGIVNEVSPFLYNQISGAGLYAPQSTPGAGVFVQPERVKIARAIAQAVVQGVGQLNTYHRPTFVTERFLLDPRRWMRSQLLQTKYHHVQAIGKRATAVLVASALVVYSDEDGDTINDTGTITFADPGFDLSEVQLFFRVADGAPTAANELWEIEPLDKLITGGNVVLSGHRGLFVKPSLWKMPYRAPNFNASSKNIGDSANASTDFVTTVDVYRVYPTLTDAVHFQRAQPCPTAEDCDFITDGGCIRIDDGRLGLLSPMRTDWFCGGWYKYVEIDYVAGIPLDTITGQPDSELERAFVRLANSKMPTVAPNLDDNSICVWAHDASPYPSEDGSPQFANCPFGSRTGAIEAWLTMTSSQYNIGYGGRIRS